MVVVLLWRIVHTQVHDLCRTTATGCGVKYLSGRAARVSDLSRVHRVRGPPLGKSAVQTLKPKNRYAWLFLLRKIGKLYSNNHIVGFLHKHYRLDDIEMYQAACKVEFQPWNRSSSQLTFQFFFYHFVFSVIAFLSVGYGYIPE